MRRHTASPRHCELRCSVISSTLIRWRHALAYTPTSHLSGSKDMFSPQSPYQWTCSLLYQHPVHGNSSETYYEARCDALVLGPCSCLHTSISLDGRQTDVLPYTPPPDPTNSVHAHRTSLMPQNEFPGPYCCSSSDLPACPPPRSAPVVGAASWVLCTATNI